MIGLGYSTDMQNVGIENCFNANAKATSNKTETVQSDKPVTYKDLKKHLNIDFADNNTVGWGPFSKTDNADYMRFVEDKEMTMSYNYFIHAEH